MVHFDLDDCIVFDSHRRSHQSIAKEKSQRHRTNVRESKMRDVVRSLISVTRILLDNSGIESVKDYI